MLMNKIREIMIDHDWHTLEELEHKTGGKPNSVSASLRSLRREDCGGYIIERRYINNAWEYRIPKKITQPESTLPSTTRIEMPEVKDKPKKKNNPVMSDDANLTMGQIIRGRRSQLFMTQKQLADMIGITLTAVNHWETQNARPTRKNIPKIAAALKIPESQLLAGKSNPRKIVAPKNNIAMHPRPSKIDINQLAEAIARLLGAQAGG